MEAVQMCSVNEGPTEMSVNRFSPFYVSSTFHL